MSDLLANPNPWVVGVGVTVMGGIIVGLVLYYVFGIGRTANKQQKIETGAPQAAQLVSIPVQTSTPAITPSPTPAFIKLTPKELMDNLNDLPPFQWEHATSYYKGQKVSWTAKFVAISKNYQGNYRLQLQYSEGFFNVGIFCVTDIETYPELKIAPRNQEIRIEGEISDISTIIDLANCKLYF